MNLLDDAPLITILEYCPAIELIRCEITCKRFFRHLRDKGNAIVNELWRKRYGGATESIGRLLYAPTIDWRGKYADVHPIISLGTIGRQPKVQISDVCMEKMRLCCRSGHSATLIDDDLLILFGGASHLFMFTNTFDLISFRQNKVLSINGQSSTAPIPRWLHTASKLGEKIIVFGGQSDRGLENDTYSMNLSFSESGIPKVRFTPITLLGAIPPPRGGHSMVVDESRNRLILFGGMTTGQVCLNDMACLSLDEEIDELTNQVVDRGLWTTIPSHGQPPSPRWCHSCCLVNDNMIVFGGWRYAAVVGSRHEFSNDVHLFNLTSLTWSKLDALGDPPRPRCQSPCWHLSSLHCRSLCDQDSSDLSPHGYLVVYGGACHADHDVLSTLLDQIIHTNAYA